VKPRPPHCSHGFAALVGVGGAGLADDWTGGAGLAEDFTGVGAGLAEDFTGVGDGFGEVLVTFTEDGLAEGADD
jgi:hypothetical protein